MTCTFFGHKDTPENIREVLYSVLVDCIENKGADTFYVGNQGSFDRIVRSTLKQLQSLYPIRYFVVLAYRPDKIISETSLQDFSDTIFPEALVTVPPRFAIDKRNRWMIERSDIIITYVSRNIGGAYKFETIARKKGKTVIRLAEKTDKTKKA
ncbi:MAG: hypothetical protein IJC45_07155 [Clostridia bacterium]|nr:hypothetical protein [Clostridia bacterium]